MPHITTNLKNTPCHACTTMFTIITTFTYPFGRQCMQFRSHLNNISGFQSIQNRPHIRGHKCQTRQQAQSGRILLSLQKTKYKLLEIIIQMYFGHSHIQNLNFFKPSYDLTRLQGWLSVGLWDIQMPHVPFSTKNIPRRNCAKMFTIITNLYIPVRATVHVAPQPFEQHFWIPEHSKSFAHSWTQMPNTPVGTAGQNPSFSAKTKSKRFKIIFQKHFGYSDIQNPNFFKPLQATTGKVVYCMVSGIYKLSHAPYHNKFKEYLVSRMHNNVYHYNNLYIPVWASVHVVPQPFEQHFWLPEHSESSPHPWTQMPNTPVGTTGQNPSFSAKTKQKLLEIIIQMYVGHSHIQNLNSSNHLMILRAYRDGCLLVSAWIYKCLMSLFQQRKFPIRTAQKCLPLLQISTYPLGRQCTQFHSHLNNISGFRSIQNRSHIRGCKCQTRQQAQPGRILLSLQKQMETSSNNHLEAYLGYQHIQNPNIIKPSQASKRKIVY